MILTKRLHINTDAHHLLFTRRMYHSGYARALREHPFLRCYVPRDTLHREIHHKLKAIPVPEGKDAKRVFEYLMRLERNGELDYDADILPRLAFLIDQLKTPSTVEALKNQYQIISEFYERESS